MIRVIIFTVFIYFVSVQGKCFKRLEINGKCLCTCEPPFNTSVNLTVSTEKALMMCSLKCSQASNCVAYNFFRNFKQCQLFDRKLTKFSFIPGCVYYYEKVEPRNRTLRFSVDNVLVQFYVNGKNISVSDNFQNVSVWEKAKTYNLPDQLYNIAIKSYNDGNVGGLIARSLDDYVLTDRTWKCIKEANDDWYKIDFNDSSWPAAVNEIEKKHGNYFSKEDAANANWIYFLNGCNNTDCKVDFYCRKSFIGTFLELNM
ncbi:hypothetical protein HELRODRAFT_180251 [Helobdella robusta]|uniref:Apple domain-containing protein n=1 Tax=Helobdella robusta TaxID=6412 RepID=T1FFM9_HELRO|nr:hypothetical protein HELRODRAFT_180251 [Helobdella robusta]ESN94083.1 hypothetical protein HELRODRAFT_180251 [Helobdella robusta]